jgi:hydrogenase maturation factor
MKLPLGKVPKDILEEVVFKNVGVKRKEVVLGPSAGIDGAVIDVDNKSIVISMDPITGALERIGWLAVNINANDVATFGVQPSFLLSCILLPEGADRKTVETISAQMNEAAKNLGISIVGGHCEVTPKLPNLTVIGCTFGFTAKRRYVTAAGAKPKDKIILTKSAGIEGTAILASDRKELLEKALGLSTLKRAQQFVSKISVVKDALTAYNAGGVNAMHDPTEGGVAGGIHEMADASGLGVKVFEDRISVLSETDKICKFFSIDPLMLIGSGALLISSKPDCAEKIVNNLRKRRIPASIVGKFLEKHGDRVIVRKNGEKKALVRPLSDHLWQALNK